MTIVKNIFKESSYVRWYEYWYTVSNTFTNYTGNITEASHRTEFFLNYYTALWCHFPHFYKYRNLFPGQHAHALISHWKLWYKTANCKNVTLYNLTVEFIVNVILVHLFSVCCWARPKFELNVTKNDCMHWKLWHMGHSNFGNYLISILSSEEKRIIF